MTIDFDHANGFFKQPNHLQDALCKLQVSATQKQVLDAIIRLTIGWQKTESHITSSQIAQMTNLRIDNIARKITVLAERKIISVQPGIRHLIKINTDYERWEYKKDKIIKPKTATIPKFRTVEKPAVSSKIEPTAKPKATRKVTPAWFKELWSMYPAYRRGGNYSFGWKKWQSLGLAEDDASKAKEWLLAAAKNDVAWAQDATSGFAFGLARFINESHWLTPAAVKPTSSGYQPPDLDNMDCTKGWEGFDVVG